jgi:hypothetical protein
MTALGHLAEAREDREVAPLVHVAIISYVR